MDCSTPGLLVHHQLPELAQTQVHWVSDAIQLSHPLSSPSLPFWVSGLQRLAEELFPSMVDLIRIILSARAPLFSGLSLQFVMKCIWCLLLNLQMDTSGQNCFLQAWWENLNATYISYSTMTWQIFKSFFFFVVNFVIHWNEKALCSHVSS